MASGPTPAIEVRGLTITFGALKAVEGLSFTAATGEVTVLLGPNGAGKSSTIECLEGYRRADGGSARVLGLDPHGDHAALVHRIGVMLQAGGVYPGIRVSEVIDLFCAFHGTVARAGELIELVGLGSRTRSTYKQLSGGEQQRLSLALALAGRPEVAFLDEPTAGVDVAGRLVIRKIIRDLASQGCAVLLTTHELDEAERLADKVIIIDHGKVVAEGTPAELMRSGAGSEIRFAAAPGLDTAALATRLDAAVTEDGPGEYLVAAEASPRQVAAITAWLAEHDLPIADLRAGRERLEDVFLRLTSGDATNEQTVTGETTAAAGRGRRRRSRS